MHTVWNKKGRQVMVRTSREEAPDIRIWTSSPVRNRVRIELRAPVDQVWPLVGDLARLSEYSSGLERVEAMKNAQGLLTEYVCHFKPLREGSAGIAHREFVRWYEPNRGFASSGEEGNAFGLSNDLNLTLVERTATGTLMTWEVYYDAEDLRASKASYDEALSDIADNLTRRFGGRVLERYVEPQPA